MANIRLKGAGWEAAVNTRGVRRSRTFKLKREAQAWARAEEHKILAAGDNGGVVADILLSELFDRYADEVSTKKRGARAECLRLGTFSRDLFLSAIRLPQLTPVHMATWRDRRLEKVSRSSVRREMALLSNVFTVAVREWGLLKENPLSIIKRPLEHASRDRRVSLDEIERLMLAASYKNGEKCARQSSRVLAAFLFAIETAMRLGEICALSWSDISGNVANLPMTKNGTSRQVPLSPAAISILQDLPKVDESVFRLGMERASALFGKIRSRACIENLHFHDSRHEAITRLADKIDVLDLARMVGIRDLKILLVYYNKKAHEIAEKLAKC